MTIQESIRPHRHDVPERTIEAGAGFRQGLWHSYSVTDGLPSSIILQMHEDRDSRIWFVTEQGVCAFDGSSFQILDLLGPLEGAPVQHIAEDELGRLWMWAPDRLACYAHRRVTVFEIPDDDTNPNCQIATDGGGVVLRYDGEYLRPIKLPGPRQGCSIRMRADDKGNELDELLTGTGGSVSWEDDLPSVVADPVQLGQVFRHLISNGLNHGGKTVPTVHISAAANDGSWVFSVCDNGIGIAPEHSEEIFFLFLPRHKRQDSLGTGIGLAVCKKIVEQHGGRIWVNSQVGEATTFRFSIPQH